MVIRCWGARGSIPVSGREYLKYGGETTCMEIRSRKGDIIIIDAGTGIRNLGKALVKGSTRVELSMLFTHAHWDHLMGFPFFKPIYRSGTHITVSGCRFSQQSIETLLSKSMKPPNFPVDFHDVKAEFDFMGDCKSSFTIGPVEVIPILFNHPNQGFGYKFVEEGKTFVFLTDNELAYHHPGGLDFRDYADFSAGADLLIHDAEFTRREYRSRRGWGHSTYRDALDLALGANAARFVLFHHNQERTDRALDAIVRDCRRIIRERGSSLTCSAAHPGLKVTL